MSANQHRGSSARTRRRRCGRARHQPSFRTSSGVMGSPTRPRTPSVLGNTGGSLLRLLRCWRRARSRARPRVHRPFRTRRGRERSPRRARLRRAPPRTAASRSPACRPVIVPSDDAGESDQHRIAQRVAPAVRAAGRDYAPASYRSQSRDRSRSARARSSGFACARRPGRPTSATTFRNAGPPASFGLACMHRTRRRGGARDLRAPGVRSAATSLTIAAPARSWRA